MPPKKAAPKMAAPKKTAPKKTAVEKDPSPKSAGKKGPSASKGKKAAVHTVAQPSSPAAAKGKKGPGKTSLDAATALPAPPAKQARAERRAVMPKNGMTPREFVFGNGNPPILTVGRPGSLLGIGLADAAGFEGPFQQVQTALKTIAKASVTGARLDKNDVPPLLLAARPMSGKTEFLTYLWRHHAELCTTLQQVHPTLKRVVVVFASYNQESTVGDDDVFHAEKHLVRRLALSLAGCVSYDADIPMHVDKLERLDHLDDFICSCTRLTREEVGIVVLVDELMKLKDAMAAEASRRNSRIPPNAFSKFLDKLCLFTLTRNSAKCFAAVVLSSLKVLPVTDIIVNESGRSVWPIVLPANIKLRDEFVARVLREREEERGVTAQDKFRIATLAQLTCEARNVQQYATLRTSWMSQGDPAPVDIHVTFGFRETAIAEFDLLRDIFACQMRGEVFKVQLLDLHLSLPFGETSDPLANPRMHDFVDRLFKHGAIIHPSDERPEEYENYTLSFRLHIGHIFAVKNRLLYGMDKILRTALLDSLVSDNLERATKGWEKSMVAALDLRRQYFTPDVELTLDVLLAKAVFVSPNLRAKRVRLWNGWLTFTRIQRIDGSYLAIPPTNPQYVYALKCNQRAVEGVITGCTELETGGSVAVLVQNKLREESPPSEVKKWLDDMVAFAKAMGPQRHVHLLFVSGTIEKSILKSHDIAAMADVIICGAEGLDDLLQAFGPSLLKSRLDEIAEARSGTRPNAPTATSEEE